MIDVVAVDQPADHRARVGRALQRREQVQQARAIGRELFQSEAQRRVLDPALLTLHARAGVGRQEREGARRVGLLLGQVEVHALDLGPDHALAAQVLRQRDLVVFGEGELRELGDDRRADVVPGPAQALDVQVLAAGHRRRRRHERREQARRRRQASRGEPVAEVARRPERAEEPPREAAGERLRGRALRLLRGRGEAQQRRAQRRPGGPRLQVAVTVDEYVHRNGHSLDRRVHDSAAIVAPRQIGARSNLWMSDYQYFVDCMWVLPIYRARRGE